MEKTLRWLWDTDGNLEQEQEDEDTADDYSRRRTIDDEFEHFEYYVMPAVKPQVAFGSGNERVDIYSRIPVVPGPGAYAVTIPNKHITSRAKTFFGSKVPRGDTYGTRLHSYGFLTYREKVKIKIPKVAFNSSAVRPPKKFLTPGPTAYPIHKEPAKQRINIHFGKRRQIMPATKIICTPINNSKCALCNIVPDGDYWHNFRTGADMCRRCMKIEQTALKSSTTDLVFRRIRLHQLEIYKAVRYCGFYHEHKGTSMAVTTLDKRIMRKKINLENYLSLYVNPQESHMHSTKYKRLR